MARRWTSPMKAPGPPPTIPYRRGPTAPLWSSRTPVAGARSLARRRIARRRGGAATCWCDDFLMRMTGELADQPGFASCGRRGSLSCRLARELVDPAVPERVPGREIDVNPAEQPDVAGRRAAA